MVEWKEIRDLFNTRNGYTPSTKDDSFWDDGTIPWFKMDDIRDNGSVLDDSKLHVTEKAIKGKGLFKANSIILATSATIGEHALITVDHLCNQRFTNLYPNKNFEDKVNMKYIYYYMFLVDEWCKQHTHQGGFASVDMEGLYKLPIPIPSLSEQNRIVGILDTFTFSIENLKQQIAERRKQYEHYRDQILDLDGKEGLKKKLGEVCGIFDGTHQTPKYTESGVKFVSVENICDLYATEKYISYDDYMIGYKTKPQKDDVLMTRIGDVGTCAVIESDEAIAYYVSLALLRPNHNIVMSKYIKYMLESKYGKVELRKRTLLTAVPLKINLGDIGKISLIILPLSEQSRIVSILDTFEASIANLESQLSQREKQYEYYRNKLLTFD